MTAVLENTDIRERRKFFGRFASSKHEIGIRVPELSTKDGSREFDNPRTEEVVVEKQDRESTFRSSNYFERRSVTEKIKSWVKEAIRKEIEIIKNKIKEILKESALFALSLLAGAVAVAFLAMCELAFFTTRLAILAAAGAAVLAGIVIGGVGYLGALGSGLALVYTSFFALVGIPGAAALIGPLVLTFVVSAVMGMIGAFLINFVMPDEY